MKITGYAQTVMPGKEGTNGRIFNYLPYWNPVSRNVRASAIKIAVFLFFPPFPRCVSTVLSGYFVGYFLPPDQGERLMGTQALKDLSELNTVMLKREAHRSKIQIMLFDAAIYTICALLGLLIIFFAG